MTEKEKHQVRIDRETRLHHIQTLVWHALKRGFPTGMDSQYFGKIPIDVHMEHGQPTGITVAGRRFRTADLEIKKSCS